MALATVWNAFGNSFYTPESYLFTSPTKQDAEAVLISRGFKRVRNPAGNGYSHKDAHVYECEAGARSVYVILRKVPINDVSTLERLIA